MTHAGRGGAGWILAVVPGPGWVRARATYRTPDGTVVVEFAAPDAGAAVAAARSLEGPPGAMTLVQIDAEGADGRPVEVDLALLDGLSP